MSLPEIHGRLGNTALLFMFIAAAWGGLRWLRKQPVDGNYFGVLVVGELLLLGQMLLGMWLWLGMRSTPVSDPPWMHILYGFLSVITLPAVYVFSKGRTEDRRDQGLYALVCLFLVAILWRAMTTASL